MVKSMGFFASNPKANSKGFILWFSVLWNYSKTLLNPSGRPNPYDHWQCIYGNIDYISYLFSSFVHQFVDRK
jgi:hypothetical protein